MRKLHKKDFNILLTQRQHTMILRLRKAGLSMSSLSRIAIRKYGDAALDSVDEAPKTRRAVIYLDADDVVTLKVIADRHKLTSSEALRRLVSVYLATNESALNSLF